MANEPSPEAGSLINAALRLSVTERVAVANAMLASIERDEDNLSQAELDKSWNDEIGRRLAEIESGQVKTVSSAEMWSRIGGKPNGGN